LMIVGSVFMRLDSTCAHQLRPPLGRVGASAMADGSYERTEKREPN
jgi:hypothetical protein